MHLAVFINSELEAILDRFYSSTLSVAGTDFARERPTQSRETMADWLLALATDLEHPQAEPQICAAVRLALEQQAAKPKHRPIPHSAEHTTSSETAIALQRLRRITMDHWTFSSSDLQGEALASMRCFNQLVDQAVQLALDRCTAGTALQSRLFQTMAQSFPDPVYVLDRTGCFLFANPATRDQFDRHTSDIVGQNAFQLEAPFLEGLEPRLHHVVNTQETIRGELLHAFAPGYGEQFEYLLVPVTNAEGHLEAVIGVSRDVSERQWNDEKMWQHANHDPLTHLPNRRLFFDRLDQEVKHANRSGLPLAVLFIDIDGFEVVNNTWGHETGNRLLCALVDRLRTCIRKADTLARLGANEFTMVLPRLQPTMDVRAVAEKLVAALAEPYHVQNHSIDLTVSIGFTLCPQDAATPKVLLRNADRAMYRAKMAGPNQIRAYEAMPY